MNNEATVSALHDGWDLLINQAKIIALLPLEDWLKAFERAESIAPIVDPTLYRNYIYDKEKRGESIQALIRAAIPLKQEILKLQKQFGGASA